MNLTRNVPKPGCLTKGLRIVLSGSLGIGIALLGSGGVGTAHADNPNDGIRAAVDGARSATGCPPLLYSGVLEDFANRYARRSGTPPAPPMSGRYSGAPVSIFFNSDDPAAATVDGILHQGYFQQTLKDCAVTDYGVGFFRTEISDDFYTDVVTVALARPVTNDPTNPLPDPTNPLTNPAILGNPPKLPPQDPPQGTVQVAPTDAISMSIDKTAFSATWTVNVTNSANISGDCTYAATNPVLPGDNKTFHINPNGSTSFTITAAPLFTTYHVAVSCSGPFNGKTVQFGHVEQDVSNP
jgi:hypothetical protein